MNRCRLFLQALWISDISDGDGKSVQESAWQGKQITNPHHDKSWPIQGQPSHADWLIWRLYINKCLTYRGLKLRIHLGLWFRSKDWPWFYSPTEDRLYYNEGDNWLFYQRIPRRNGRPIFSKTGIPTSVPSILHHATVYSKGNYWVCSGHAPTYNDIETSYSSFTDALAASPTSESWCFQSLDIPDDFNIIAEAIRNRSAVSVSNGSFKEGYGTAAWVIEGDDARGRLVGRAISPGSEQDQSPYRSELTGIYATMLTVQKICQYFNVTEGAIELGCDGMSAIDRAFSCITILNIEEPCYDLISAIKKLWTYSPILWKVQHVRGHQEEEKQISELSRLELLNIEMDKEAKAFLNRARQCPQHYVIHAEPWSLWLGDKKVVRDLSESVYEYVHAPEARAYWMEKKSISQETFDSINWEAVQQAYRSASLSRRTFVSKHVVGMCGVGSQVERKGYSCLPSMR